MLGLKLREGNGCGYTRGNVNLVMVVPLSILIVVVVTQVCMCDIVELLTHTNERIDDW